MKEQWKRNAVVAAVTQRAVLSKNPLAAAVEGEHDLHPSHAVDFSQDVIPAEKQIWLEEEAWQKRKESES